jgi:hypothetical protein
VRKRQLPPDAEAALQHSIQAAAYAEAALQHSIQAAAYAEAALQHSIWRVGGRFRLTLKLRFSTPYGVSAGAFA